MSYLRLSLRIRARDEPRPTGALFPVEELDQLVQANVPFLRILPVATVADAA